MITAVIFDYGGTLVYPRDSWERIKPRAVYETYKALYDNGLKMSLEEFISFEESFFDEYSKLEAEEKMDVPDIEKYGKLVEQLFPEKSREWWESLAKTITAVFWSVVINNYDVRTDAHQTLETLRSREFKMAIISNHHNHEALVGHLKGMGLDGFFFPIISSCQFPFKKPDSRIFNVCLDILRVKSSNAVYVGDTPDIDVVGAKLAGMKSVLIRDPLKEGETFAMPDRIISNLSELISVIPQL